MSFKSSPLSRKVSEDNRGQLAAMINVVNKNEKEAKIMEELMKFLRAATRARLIIWEATGKEVRKGDSLYRGYQANFYGFYIKTIISQKKIGRFNDLLWAVSISKDGENVVFTNLRYDGVVWLCLFIQETVESRGLENQLLQKLAQSLSS